MENKNRKVCLKILHNIIVFVCYFNQINAMVSIRHFLKISNSSDDMAPFYLTTNKNGYN